MNLQELKNNGIRTPEALIRYLNKHQTGYYFLPNEISKLIASLVKLNSPQSLINLNSNFGEILNIIDEVENKIGIEINAEKVEISNFLYPDLYILKQDPLSYQQKDKNFESVVCVPPLGINIEINGVKKRSEELYISKGLSLLSSEGTAIFLLPNNFLTAPVYGNIRDNILQNYGLKTVISLSHGIWRNIGREYYILEIANTNIEDVSYYKFNLEKNIISRIKNNEPDFSIPKVQLKERWDYTFHSPKSKEHEEELKQFNTKKVEDLVDIIVGIGFKTEDRAEQGHYQILSGRNIINEDLKPSRHDRFLTRSDLSDREQKGVLQDGDIIITQTFREKIGIYTYKSTKHKYIANQSLIILRGKNAAYVALSLNTETGASLFNRQAIRHSRSMMGTHTISTKDLREIHIPILPLDDLELASKSKLENLSNEQKLATQDEYMILQSSFEHLKKENPDNIQIKQMFELLMEMKNTLDQVLDKQEIVITKIDDLQSTLNELSTEFKSIKKLNRDIDDKIIRFQKTIDDKLNILLRDQVEIDAYIVDIKRWFDYYDILEVTSQQYLPEAEYIYDQISQLENPDYSPFILQYCRALENELLKKIFRAYVQSIIDRKIDIEHTFAWDFGKKTSGKPNSENTFRFCKDLKRYLNKDNEEWFFELGKMEFNLRYLTGKTVEKSPLLQDLKKFVLEKFESDILNIEYLDDIKNIIHDYRNQSAHPGLMDSEKAAEFHKQIKECLINLMTNYKH